MTVPTLPPTKRTEFGLTVPSDAFDHETWVMDAAFRDSTAAMVANTLDLYVQVATPPGSFRATLILEIV